MNDHAGKKYGMLTAVRKTRRQRHGAYLWEFSCDCGETCFRTPSNVLSILRNGQRPSCGCCRTTMDGQELTPARVVEVGERFGLLVVTKPSHRDGNRFFHCRCDCGNRTVVRANLLRYGQTRSCGHLSGRVKPKNFMPVARFKTVAAANDDFTPDVGTA